MLLKYNPNSNEFEAVDAVGTTHSPFGPIKAYRVGPDIYVESSWDVFGPLAMKVYGYAHKLLIQLGIEVPKPNNYLVNRNTKKKADEQEAEDKKKEAKKLVDGLEAKLKQAREDKNNKLVDELMVTLKKLRENRL